LRGPEHVIVFHNDQYRALFPGRDLDGKVIRQVLPELEGQGIYALLDQVYRTGEPYIGNEVPMQFDRAGEGRPSEHYFNLVYHPARDREGRVEGILVHAVEVTEQVVARQLLAAEKERVEALVAERTRELARQRDLTARIVDNAPISMSYLNRDLVYEWVNPSQARTYGIPVEQWLGRTVYEVLGPETEAQTSAYWQQALDGEPFIATSFPFKFSRDGVDHWTYWDFSYNPVRGADGEVAGILVLGQEVSARVASERALREREARYRSLFEASTLYIGVLDPDGTILEANRACVEIAGVPREAIIGKRFWEAAWWRDVPASQAMIEAAVYRVASAGEEVRGEGAFMGVGGQLRHVDVSLSPIKDEVGKTRLISVYGIDITEKKHAERALAQVNEELEQRQRERIAALEQTDEMKDQFLGILSHELRTPLNAIQGFGSILADGIAGDLTPEQTRFVGKILDSSDLMLDLVDDLLDMSRVQAGKFALELQDVEVPLLIRNTLAGLSAEAMQKGHSLVNEVPASLPVVKADPRRLSQVVSNLITNAIKYTPEGGTITVRARVDAGTPRALRVEVSDTGIGVPPEQQERIFQAFTQVDMSSTREIGGVGLGLSIVKALVEAHGGVVGLESDGAGSTFFFSLPLPPEA
jgi:PAS domain S-box-containing protein